MKRVVILGSTGTIGVNTLRVIERFPDDLQVAGLAAFNNSDLLAEQVRAFRPRYVGVSRRKKSALVSALNGRDAAFFDAEDALGEMCSLNDVDVVVIGISGRAALEPFLAAVRAGKVVAPANKEALVIAGDILMREARTHGAVIIPVDSEQSAIFQCLRGQERGDLKKVYLTASGGPLRNIPRERFDDLTVEEVLRHPRWEMGPKITVDSATMMNKGFEVIEALRLFDLTPDQVEVVVHPQAVVHSLVCFRDGSLIAQLGAPDMRVPIQYALTYPERWVSPAEDLDLVRVASLDFERPDLGKFPCLRLAMGAACAGGIVPCVLNAVNEVAVEAFLKGEIRFTEIYRIVEELVGRHPGGGVAGLEEILATDTATRQDAAEYIRKMKR